MAVLSKRFSNSSELLLGTPPDSKKTKTLSRKAQSELNLSTFGKIRPPPSVTDSIASAFSGGSGDALPDETSVASQPGMDPATECNALFALRELGTLVARRRGLQPESFNHGLMMLFSQARPAEGVVVPGDEKKADAAIQDASVKSPSLEQSTTQARTVRKFQSQPQPNTQQKHHRQFSFEPGADQLQALTEEAPPRDVGSRDDESENSDAPLIIHAGRQTEDSASTSLTGSCQNLSADFAKPSKIPSPVQSLGRSRKESSASSLPSVYARSQDTSRRGSSSSVLTAFRENASGSVRPRAQSRNSSMQSLHATTGPLAGAKEHYGSIGLRNHKIATTAAATSAAAAAAGGSTGSTGSIVSNGQQASGAETDGRKAMTWRANEEAKA